MPAEMRSYRGAGYSRRMFDLVIRNATLVDGTGSAPREGVDIGMLAGRVVDVGRSIGGTAKRTIDADGQIGRAHV